MYMKPIQILVTVVLLLVVGGASFYGGIKYQSSRRANGQFFGQGAPGTMRNGANGANRNAFRPVNGSIISSDDKSITVKLNDGSSRIVFLAGNTVIDQNLTAAKADLKIGQNVAVIGQQNADGSVTAQTIQLNPLTPSARNSTGTGSAQTQ